MTYYNRRELKCPSKTESSPDVRLDLEQERCSMKRIVSIFIAVAVVALSVPCFADSMSKFQGGVKDVIMSPLQVSDNVKTETKDAKFLPFALAGGILKGSFYMAKQIVTGTLNVVTSPLEMMHK